MVRRLYHTTPVGEETVDHHADGYNGCIELAKGENYTLAASNSASLIYFSIEVYAYDISVPGEGCLGKPVAEADDGHGHGGAVTSSTVAAASTAVSSSTSVDPTRVVPATSSTSVASAASATSSASGQECHTHADGAVHCV